MREARSYAEGVRPWSMPWLGSLCGVLIYLTVMYNLENSNYPVFHEVCADFSNHLSATNTLYWSFICFYRIMLRLHQRVQCWYSSRLGEAWEIHSCNAPKSKLITTFGGSLKHTLKSVHADTSFLQSPRVHFHNNRKTNSCRVLLLNFLQSLWRWFYVYFWDTKQEIYGF